MARKLLNNKVKEGYRHYCAECGAPALTTVFPVWGSRNAFCSKACSREFHSLKRMGLILVFLTGHVVAFCAPWFAALLVVTHLNDEWFALPAAFATLVATGAIVSFPIHKWLASLD
jgi:hypothetical protein